MPATTAMDGEPHAGPDDGDLSARPDVTTRAAAPDGDPGAAKRDKGKHAAETGVFPAITAEALAAEALAASVALDPPAAGAPDPFMPPATAAAGTGVAPSERPSTGQATVASTAEQPLIEVPGDDSPTIADYVPALAIVAVDEAADDDDNHYRGARRRRSGRRRYPVGALLVVGVIVVIIGVVAVQLFSGNARTPVVADDTPTGSQVTPNLAVPPPDSPSAVDSPSAAASATRSHAAATTKAVVPPPVSHPASPAAPTTQAVASRSGSLALVNPANRCATVGRGGGLVLGGCGQTFTMPGDGTMQMHIPQMGTFCVDTSRGATANLTPVVLAPCNGSGTQKWAFGGNSTLTNGQAGRCLDAEGGNTADGTRLILWDCSGSTNQRWRFG